MNPYRDWLGIESKPPYSHYTLLGVDAGESRNDVITEAMEQRYSTVRQYQSGTYGDDAQRILDELSAAFHCLTSRTAREAYDFEQTVLQDVLCPHCNADVAITRAMAGRTLPCAECGEPIAFPAALPPRPALPPKQREKPVVKDELQENARPQSATAWRDVNDPSAPGTQHTGLRIVIRVFGLAAAFFLFAAFVTWSTASYRDVNARPHDPSSGEFLLAGMLSLVARGIGQLRLERYE